MLRRIKRFLGFSARGTYFPNNEVAPADGSLVSTASRKSTKSERKLTKKEKNKSPLSKHNVTAPAFLQVSSPPTEIVIGGEESVACSVTEDRQTVITDSLPYRDPSDKVFLESPPLSSQPPASSTRSLAGSGSMQSRLELVTSEVIKTDGVSSVESVYSVDIAEDTFQDAACDAKSRELPVDCEMPIGKPSLLISPQTSSASSTSNDLSSLCVNLPTVSVLKEEEFAKGAEEAAAMKKFNAELDGLLKTSAPPFQVSTARLPPMLNRELPPATHGGESLLSNDEFNDSKNNSVARILNESHEATTRSPENKHLRSYGY
uniref:Uncharacterized protein n=1 Tax=Caenorhabditis japonica TaxID=281687 RepID=A0A8R1I0T4_CAEJA